MNYTAASKRGDGSTVRVSRSRRVEITVYRGPYPSPLVAGRPDAPEPDGGRQARPRVTRLRDLARACSAWLAFFRFRRMRFSKEKGSSR